MSIFQIFVRELLLTFWEFGKMSLLRKNASATFWATFGKFGQRLETLGNFFIPTSGHNEYHVPGNS